MIVCYNLEEIRILNDDATVYTFKIRDDAYWVNKDGELVAPVVADYREWKTIFLSKRDVENSKHFDKLRPISQPTPRKSTKKELSELCLTQLLPAPSATDYFALNRISSS